MDPCLSDSKETVNIMKFGAVLFRSSCHKIPEAGWLINNRNLFLMVLGVGKSKIRVLGWPGEGPLSGS